MSATFQIKSEKYDEATLRLSCAKSILTMVEVLIDERNGIVNNNIITEALHGVGLMIADADSALAL